MGQAFFYKAYGGLGEAAGIHAAAHLFEVLVQLFQKPVGFGVKPQACFNRSKAQEGRQNSPGDCFGVGNPRRGFPLCRFEAASVLGVLEQGWFSLARGVFGATPKGVLLRRRRFFCRQKKQREKDRSRGKPFDVSPLEKPLFPST